MPASPLKQKPTLKQEAQRCPGIWRLSAGLAHITDWKLAWTVIRRSWSWSSTTLWDLFIPGNSKISHHFAFLNIFLF